MVGFIGWVVKVIRFRRTLYENNNFIRFRRTLISQEYKANLDFSGVQGEPCTKKRLEFSGVQGEPCTKKRLNYKS
jgi:hypothetical protein